MNIEFEKDVLSYLNLPSIPIKEWNGKDGFKDGVAVIEYRNGNHGYAIAEFDPQVDSEPRIKKVFTLEPFKAIVRIMVVPAYMNNDVSSMDLDDESKKAAERLANEVTELENDGVDFEMITTPKNEFFFDNITNDEQGRAFIKAYNQSKRIRGKVPKNHDAIVARLAVIWSDENKKGKRK